MKLLIISDIHGSSYYAKKILEIKKRENPDKIVLLGDLYYHGPRNSLTKEYDPKIVAEILNSFFKTCLTFLYLDKSFTLYTKSILKPLFGASNGT